MAVTCNFCDITWLSIELKPGDVSICPECSAEFDILEDGYKYILNTSEKEEK